MESKQVRLQSRIGNDINEFRQQQKTLQLASITKDGLPHISYSPFVYLSDCYYIFISDIAKHGQNLKINPQVSIMMIEDEEQSKNIYARKRLTFDTEANLIARDSQHWQTTISTFEQQFGEIVSNLSKLSDFHLYQLVPKAGRFVKGFGQAFDISGADQVDVVHLDKGHTKQSNA